MKNIFNDPDLEARMAAFDAGLCTLGAAMFGGAAYERDLAESAAEAAKDAAIAQAAAECAPRIAEPIAAAINGWLKAYGKKVA